MRLIDANALVDRITDLADANRRWKPEYSAFCDDMVCMIEDTPFWDVDDLRPKGRWIDAPDMDEFWGELVFHKCSLCDELQYIETNYCPNCGADMREG